MNIDQTLESTTAWHAIRSPADCYMFRDRFSARFSFIPQGSQGPKPSVIINQH